MTYVVTDSCVKCKYTDCVEVCPVDCFYEGENFLVIKNHEENDQKIIKKFKELDLNTSLQKTNKNKKYFEENFVHPHITTSANTLPMSLQISLYLSFFK